MKAIAMAVAILIASTAFGQGTKDQQNYCKYIEEQAAAQRDLQRMPTLSAGLKAESCVSAFGGMDHL
jgi:hypothetical protein